MLNFLKELYFTAFSIFFKLGVSGTLGYNAGKGITGVTLLQGAFLVGIVSWFDIIVGTRVLSDIPKWLAVSIFLVLCAANYYLLVVCRHGIVFESEFAKLPKSRKKLLLANCMAIMLSVIVFFIYSSIVHRRFVNGLIA